MGAAENRAAKAMMFPVGAASPLWFAFSAVASAGVAWWLLTRVTRPANLEAMQALTLSAGRLPDPQLVIGVDNLPVTGADAYSTTSDFMTMRKVGVMQAFPAATKRKLQGERAAAEEDVAQAALLGSRLEVARNVAQAWIRRATAEASLNELSALESDVELQAYAARGVRFGRYRRSPRYGSSGNFPAYSATESSGTCNARCGTVVA